jgi:hypothetical protein
VLEEGSLYDRVMASERDTWVDLSSAGDEETGKQQHDRKTEMTTPPENSKRY